MPGYGRPGEDAYPEEPERGSAVHGPLERLHPVYVSFGDSGAPAQGQAGSHCVKVLAEEAGEALHGLRCVLLGLKVTDPASIPAMRGYCVGGIR